jgi:hypothetical protein
MSMSNSINISRLSASATSVAVAAAAGDVSGADVTESAPRAYTPEGNSVDEHPPAPEWFQDAKFGIYFHWGAFSAPAFDNEWYPRSMYQAGSDANQHHTATYGVPSAWPYHNFVDGARDLAGDTVEFAPQLKSAGGAFDPEEWVQLFVEAGARFAGPLAEHHDGFSMWDSQVNEWNSVDKGPGLDLLGLFSTAIRAKGLKHGEGPTKMGGGSFTTPHAGTAQDIRFTRDKAGNVLYATVLGWPGSSLAIKTLSTDRINLSSLTSVKLLGTTAGTYIDLPTPSQNASGLTITLPSSAPYSAEAYVLKLDFSGTIPPLRPLAGAIAFTDVDYTGKAAVLTLGDHTAADLSAAGSGPGTLSSLRPAPGHQVIGYSGDDFTGASWTFTADNPDLRGTGDNDRITSLRVRFDPATYFRITNATNGLALDSGGNAVSGSSLEQGTWNGDHNLQWQAEQVEGGYYRLVNRATGMVADGGGATSDGSAARQASWSGGASQQWTLTHRGGDRCSIANRATGLVLDGGGDVDSGSSAKQWAYGSSTNLLWSFTAL